MTGVRSDESRLYVFFPKAWDVARAEAEYLRKWGPGVVRDGFDWSVIVQTKVATVLVAGGRIDLGGLGLTWERQRSMEQMLRNQLKEVALYEQRGF